MCFPVLCGLRVVGVLLCLEGLLKVADAIRALAGHEKIEGAVLILITLPFLYAVYLYVRWLCEDTRENRQALQTAQTIILVHAVLFVILVVVGIMM